MTNRHAGKTVMVGLDGVDLTLVERWAQEGHLPCLQGFLDSSHLIETSCRSLPGSEWANFATGVSPSKHGYVHETQIETGSYENVAIHSDHVAAEPFYKLLSEAGHRCAILDVPGDHPLPSINGLQVIDWGTEFQLWKFDTQPSEFRQELLEHVGKHPFTNYPGTQTNDQSLRELKVALERGIRLKTDLAHYVMRKSDWDFFFVSLCEGHKAGHFFWKFWDEQHPDHDSSDPHLRSALLDIYKAMDRGLQSIVDALDPLDNVILLADRGMRANHRGDHLLNAVLQRLGLLTDKKAKTGARSSEASETLKGSAVWRSVPLRRELKRFVPLRLRAFARKLLGSPQLDWEGTQAFMLPNVGNSYIRINLAGREPRGTVQPGEQYDKLLAFIEAEMYALINPATGRPAVEDVSFPRRLYPGPLADDLPDVAVVWRAEAPIRELTSPAVGLVRGDFPERRSGNHTTTGFVLARGPAFVPGASRRAGDLRQLAPTVLKIHGHEVPDSYEMASLGAIMAGAATAQTRTPRQAEHRPQVPV
ncbi:MAG: alkaline phosphatase family protein [Gammaproteobacteria bacterium]